MLEWKDWSGTVWDCFGLEWVWKCFFRSYPLKHISTQSSKTSLEIFLFDLWWKRYKKYKNVLYSFFSLPLCLWPVLSAVGLKSEVCSLDSLIHLLWSDFLSVLRRVISQALDEQLHSHVLCFSQGEVGVLNAPVSYVLWFLSPSAEVHYGTVKESSRLSITSVNSTKRKKEKDRTRKLSIMLSCTFFFWRGTSGSSLSAIYITYLNILFIYRTIVFSPAKNGLYIQYIYIVLSNDK